MLRWSVVVCIALLAPAVGAWAAEPLAMPPAKAVKRKAKPVKAPAPLEAAPRPLHLGLHGLSLKRHHPEWHLESVAPPGLERQGSGSGTRALALAGGPSDEQRVEFGIAPLVPLKLPTPLATGPDGTVTPRSPTAKAPLPVAQVYMRYSW